MSSYQLGIREDSRNQGSELPDATNLYTGIAMPCGLKLPLKNWAGSNFKEEGRKG